ncbi:MAG: hypothetical protein V1909_06355, partial [Candidatus Micrarchaeota archaeon]
NIAVVVENGGNVGEVGRSLGLEQREVDALHKLKGGMHPVECFRQIKPHLKEGGFEENITWLQDISSAVGAQAEKVIKEKDGMEAFAKTAKRVHAIVSEIAGISGREIADAGVDLGLTKEQVEAFGTPGGWKETYPKIRDVVQGETTEEKNRELTAMEETAKRKSDEFLTNLAVLELKKLVDGLHRLGTYNAPGAFDVLKNVSEPSSFDVAYVGELVHKKMTGKLSDEDFANTLKKRFVFLGVAPKRLDTKRQLDELLKLNEHVAALLKLHSPEGKAVAELSGLVDVIIGMCKKSSSFDRDLFLKLPDLLRLYYGDTQQIAKLAESKMRGRFQEGDFEKALGNLSFGKDLEERTAILRAMKNALAKFSDERYDNYSGYNIYLSPGCLGRYGYTTPEGVVAALAKEQKIKSEAEAELMGVVDALVTGCKQFRISSYILDYTLSEIIFTFLTKENAGELARLVRASLSGTVNDSEVSSVAKKLFRDDYSDKDRVLGQMNAALQRFG